jgi:hypothetical protein
VLLSNLKRPLSKTIFIKHHGNIKDKNGKIQGKEKKFRTNIRKEKKRKEI